MFVSGLICFVVFLLLSMILFVKNDIAKIVGDLTGWNAKHTIRKMTKLKMDKAKADQESGLGKEISVRTAELFDDIIKDDNESSGEVVQEKNHVENAKKTEMIMNTEKTSSENGIFQAEEDMTVLGGEAFKRVSSKTREEDVFYEAENLEEPETGILSSASYERMLSGMNNKKTSLDEEQTAALIGESTAEEELVVDDTMVLETEVDMEGTEILEEFTSVLPKKGELENEK